MRSTEMISFDKAFQIVMDSAYLTGTEKIRFTLSPERILAEDIRSDIDMPPFNKAAVDGFACKREELDNDLAIIETIAAGKVPGKKIGRYECSRIMTGAIVPEGADCVVMVEETEILPSGRMKFNGSYVKENFSVRGEDIKKGDIVLKKGTMIKPQDIAVLATVGKTEVMVSVAPRIAIISSGSELVEPDVLPLPAQIRNSNAYQLIAQAERMGMNPVYYGIAKDDEAETEKILKRAISENDVVIITGGVSMGDFDFIPSVLEKAGVSIRFSRVAVQPGKPTTFGIHPKAIIFGLPGNPVSSFVQFELLVRPLLFKMMGYNWKPLEIKQVMKSEFSRKFADRMALVPVAVDDEGFISPVEFHGSAHISSLSHAFGIISVPAGVKTIKKGETVSVRQI